MGMKPPFLSLSAFSAVVIFLLLSPYQHANKCAAQMERATQEEVKTVNSMRLAIAALRTQTFGLVVADENLLESTPGSSDALIQRMETASPLWLDMASLRPEKIAKLVVAALKRRALEYKIVREQAIAELRSELKSDVTGLLLSSEMVLKSGGLSPRSSERVNSILETAQRMKTKLDAKAKA
jgi:signal transduction histidine kinase